MAFQTGGAVVPPVAGFAITGISIPAAGQVKLTFGSTADAAYTVSRSINLTDWTPLPGPVTGAAGQTAFTDTTVPANTTALFYRVTRTSP